MSLVIYFDGSKMHIEQAVVRSIWELFRLRDQVAVFENGEIHQATGDWPYRSLLWAIFTIDTLERDDTNDYRTRIRDSKKFSEVNMNNCSVYPQ